jgi:phage portal protein BeeE
MQRNRQIFYKLFLNAQKVSGEKVAKKWRKSGEKMAKKCLLPHKKAQ